MKRIPCLLFVCAILTACGGGSGDTTPAPPANPFENGDNISLGSVNTGDLFASALDSTNEITVVGSYRDDDAGQDAGAVYILRRIGTSFSTSAKILRPEAPTTEDRFGRSVGISGSFIVVGAPYNDTFGEDAGAAYVYQRVSDTDWNLVAELVPPHPEAGEMFGWSVAIHKGVAVVGAINDSDNWEDDGPISNAVGVAQGSVFVFREADQWQFSQKLLPGVDQGDRWDNFGRSVAIHDDYLAVSARGTLGPPYNEPGSVYLYRPAVAGWALDASVQAADGLDDDLFGTTIDLRGDTLVVTAPGNHNSLAPDPNAINGAAYVFRHDGSQWSQHIKLEPPSAEPDDGFGGGDISLNDRYLAVGAPLADVVTRFNGETWIFDVADWRIVKVLQAKNPLAEDLFGAALTLADDDVIFTGAPRRCNSTGCLAGALYFNY